MGSHIMNTKTRIYAVIVFAGLLAGCKPVNPPVDSPPAKDTNVASASTFSPMVGNDATGAGAASNQSLTGVRSSLQAAADYTYDQKDAFLTKAGADLAVLDQKIQALSDKAANADDAIKAGVKSKLQNLRDQRAELEQKLAKVKAATAADWAAAKADFQNTWGDVKAAFQDAWHALVAS
jgi:hypothetical protein